ncbi:VWA domain-containing protein [Methylocystis sp. S23]
MRLRLDLRLLSLALAASLLVATFVAPRATIERDGFEFLAIVDITGSMNVRDEGAPLRPMSRLDAVKTALREMIADLPCPSRVGLGVFTERRPFLLFEPFDACANFPALAASIEALDWRMAWEGDSRISAGLFRAIEMARDLGADLLFFSDGHEAPPPPAAGGPAFEGKPSEVRGLIVGVGGQALAPIPKFDDKGRESGFVGVDEVPHENRFGPPPEGAERREGYNPRNAPFGAAAAVGVEHLSSVKEAHLRALAEKTGLAYAPLGDARRLRASYADVATKRPRAAELDLRPFLGAAAGFCLVMAYAGAPLAERRMRARHASNPKRRRQS